MACEHDAARPMVSGGDWQQFPALFGRTNSCVVRPSLAFDSFIMR